jgi:monothiol glutaredoxin
MTRALLPFSRVHPAARLQIEALYADTVAEVEALVSSHPVVVIGMAGNPFVRRARRALDGAGIAHMDHDYGSYLSQWRRRGALKMWSGWPTFPMVFVRGQLVGGADDLQRLLSSGELTQLLSG